MPCWVAPVVAAELWGVSLNHVLCAIADGTLPSRREYGFVVVDVAPEGTCPQPRREGPPPRTYVLASEVTPEVLGDFGVPPAPVPEVPPIFGSDPIQAPAPAPIVDDSGTDELPPLDEEEDDKPISNWRQVRANMARVRKPPGRTPPAAFAA